MESDPIKQKIIDEEHLRLLALFHYISGGITILFSSIFIIHLSVLGFLMSSPDLFGTSPKPEVDPHALLAVMFYIFLTLVVLGITYGIVQIISGRCLARHRHRTFSLIVAIPNMLFIPYGTILGVMTLMVLGRESVKNLYSEGAGS